MKPIAEDATPDDPRWEVAFLDLTHGFVMAGAKVKIISRFTGFPQGRIRKLYKTLRGIDPPAGPVMQGKARFFAMPSKHTSAAWSVQCATFLACYDRVGKITERPVHRGWQLLASFGVYLSLTEKLHRAAAIRRLDINQAYALLTHCGFMTQSAAAELQRTECRTCLISYPIVTTEPLEAQVCPVCAMNENDVRLSRLRLKSGRRNSGPKA